MSKTSRNIMAGAGILALAGLIAKILSAVYRVPLQNLVGNTGFYVYQQVYPLYGIGMVLALSGFPLFIAKLATEFDDADTQRFVMKRLFWLLLGLGAGGFSLIYGGAPWLSEAMGQDPQLTIVIRAVAWMFWLMPCLAVGRGYSQGQLDMAPTAVSQIVEQLIRVTVIIGMAWFGVTHAWSNYSIGAAAMFGATIAGVVAVACMLGPLCQVWQPLVRPISKEPTIRWSYLLRRLVREGGLLALLAALLVLLQLVDSFSVKSLLTAHGWSNNRAEYIKGVYDRGQPLLQLGMVLATGLGTSLLPALHEHFMQKQWVALQHDFQITIRLALVLSGVSTIGLMVIMPQVNQVLFGSREGSMALMWFVLAIVPATLITILSSVLQSLNRTTGLSWLIGICLLAKWGLNQWLVPDLGITGAAVSTTVALLPLLGYALLRIPRHLWQGWQVTNHWWIRYVWLLVSLGSLAVISRTLGDYWFGTSRLGSAVTMVITALVGVVTFIMQTNWLGLLTIFEWRIIPKGERLYNMLKRGKTNAFR